MKKLILIFAIGAALNSASYAQDFPSSGDPNFDSTFKQIVAGKSFSKDFLSKEVGKLRRELSQYKGEDNKVRIENLADAYTVFIRMSLISPIRQGGWPYRHVWLDNNYRLNRLYSDIVAKYGNTDKHKVFYAYCAICPVIIKGDYGLALSLLTYIKDNSPAYYPFAKSLAERTIDYRANLPDEGLKEFIRKTLSY